MDLPITLILLTGALLLLAVSNIMSRRPSPIGRVWPVPYNALQFISLLVSIAMAAHLVTLLTGTPFAGRMGN
ncbi:hypothetical protein [Govanella unica]|uniref:Uncharacterized protein n=1 Tax=Govanella unica TaxID=2975056 RepID=A0A9X3Z729_9PROT|nr:hypothetical protein [Govania unica]MDA5193727.1 hypothetical protein [Govania unica]